MPSFRCPSCGEPLGEVVAGIRCPNGHSFDRAREGYVNLLPAGRVKGRPSGDDDMMVRARRSVFDAGLYDPVINGVADAVVSALAGIPAADVLDIGCGEGSYGHAIAARSDAQVWGIDISKAAVKLAARRSDAGRVRSCRRASS